MYTNGAPIVVAGGALAYTGLDIGWGLVTAFTLLFAGLAVTHIAPKLRKSKGE